MAQQKQGWLSRLYEGKEKSEDYARNSLPTNRWSLFWDIFKGNFGKIVKVNLLILLFFLPLVGVLFFSWMMQQGNNLIFPFSANLGVGYPAYPNQVGLSEYFQLQGAFVLYVGIFFSSFIAAIGLAGGMYVIRNMVWTEGIFVSNDFWRGIKLNYKNALQTVLVFTVVFALCGSLLRLSEFTLALQQISGFRLVMMRIFQGMSYLLIIVAAMMCFWMVALGVNYQSTFVRMLKNSFLLTVGTLPQTVFFVAAALVPFLLLLIGGNFFTTLTILILILFGFAWALLVWLDFAQWVFDKYLNPKIKGAKVGRGIYNAEKAAVEKPSSEAELEYQRMILAHGKSKLMDRPIKPIDDSLQVYELPTAFTREDLKRLRESKEHIQEDTEAYAEEHKNDLRYVEYNKQFEEREKALQDDPKNKKKKPPKMLGR
jgi:hypothetical protein